MSLHCYHDGFAIHGAPVYAPIRMKDTNHFQMGDIPFCSLSCAKASRRESVDTIELFTLYHRRVLGINSVPIAPSPLVLSVYNRDGVGLSIEEFRNSSTIHRARSNNISPVSFFAGKQTYVNTLFEVDDSRTTIPDGYSVETT